MNKKFLVATGIVVIAVMAETPAGAIAALKQRIVNRRHQKTDPIIGMSLVQAYDNGELNFIVMDESRSALLCGELDGRFQPQVTRELADKLRACVSDDLYYSLPG
jgi:hypothetical protein